MAIGAVRAAGIAAVALGYHFWKLLTKQDFALDDDPAQEVKPEVYIVVMFCWSLGRLATWLIMLTALMYVVSEESSIRARGRAFVLQW